MLTFILTVVIVLVTLSAISHFAGRQAHARGDDPANKSLTLLPGDIAWENKSGNVKVYFPITTSIVLSIVLTLLLRFLS